MAEILDRSHDDDGNITQFLVLTDEGKTTTKKASPENMLLYDPGNEMPFDGGIKRFLSGDSGIKIEGETDVAVAQSGNEYSFIVSVDGSIVETMPDEAGDVLQAVYESLSSNSNESLVSLHDRLSQEQVRQNLVSSVAKTFKKAHRIEIVSNGWLVDGLYLVDWSANIYANRGEISSDYVRKGSDVIEKDTTHEFVKLDHDFDFGDEERSIEVGGDGYTLSKRELLFLGKVKWLLYRRHYHENRPFWYYTDRWSDVDAKTGVIEDGDELPDLETFNI